MATNKTPKDADKPGTLSKLEGLLLDWWLVARDSTHVDPREDIAAGKVTFELLEERGAFVEMLEELERRVPGLKRG